MEEYSVVEKFRDGDIIVEEGYQSNYAYIVLSGEVKVTKKAGDKKVVIGTLKKGDVFGEMGLIDKALRCATVIAVGDVTVGMIDREKFIEWLNQIPSGMRFILNALVDRLKITTERLANIGVQLDAAKKTITAFSLKTREKEG